MKSSSAYAGRRLREETHDHKTAAQYREFRPWHTYFFSEFDLRFFSSC